MLKIYKTRITESTLNDDIAAVKKQYPKIADETFYKLIAFDPTYSKDRDSVGTYGKWILTQFNRGNITDKDFGHLKDALTRFEDNKKNLKDKDIGKFKTLQEIDDYLNNEDNYKELSHRQEVRQRQTARKNVDLGEEAELVYEDSDWEVWVPKTYAASCKLGQGASWCTASTENDYYYNYYKNNYGGDYYININKNDPEEKYQFHFESNQFMDKDDRPIDLFDFLENDDGLKSFYAEDIKNTWGIDITQDTQMVTLPFENFAEAYGNDYHYRDELGKDFIEDCVSEFYLREESPLYDRVVANLYFDISDSDAVYHIRDNEDEINSMNLGYTAEDIIDIIENGESNIDETYQSEIEDAVRNACYDGYEVGTVDLVGKDFEKAVKNAIPDKDSYIRYDIKDVAGGGILVELTTKDLLKAMSEENVNMGDGIEWAVWPYYIDNFKFYEPQYGWNGFDDDTFLERLNDELPRLNEE